MAVSFTQQPAYATPSDNPIIFQFRQTLSGKYNMSFVVMVFAGGEIGTFEVFPETEDATYKYGKIDVSNIVAPYIPTQNLKPLTSATIHDPAGWFQVYIDVYEKYSTTPNGAITINPTFVSSSIISVFKAKLSKSEFLNFNYTDYQKGTTKKFLTDFKLESGIYVQTPKKEDSLSLTWIDNTDIDTPTDYKVRYLYLNGLTVLTSATETFLAANQGLLGSVYFNLDQHVSLGYLTSGQAASCTTVWMSLTNMSNTNISPISVITFDTTCFYNGATLRFMNKFGAYDNYLFTYNKRYSASVKSFEFERSQGSWNDTTYELSKTNTGRLSYLKQTTKKLELVSDWLDETTQNWLTQLYDSPAVYINENTEDESVIVVNSSYQIKQDKHDELYNEIVEIEFTPENSIRL